MIDGKQLGLSDDGLTTVKKQTKREKFLPEMELVAWQALLDPIGQIFATVNSHLSARGMTMRQGTIVDTSLSRTAARSMCWQR